MFQLPAIFSHAHYSQTTAEKRGFCRQVQAYIAKSFVGLFDDDPLHRHGFGPRQFDKGCRGYEPS